MASRRNCKSPKVEKSPEEKALDTKKRADERLAKKESFTDEQLDNYKINDEIPFTEWCSIIWTSEDPTWQFKAQQTTPPQAALRCITKQFIVATKFHDYDKIFPRQQRLDLLTKEFERSGSTEAPANLNQASWKYDVLHKWKTIGGDDQVLVRSAAREEAGKEAFLVMLKDNIYQQPSEARLFALEKYHEERRNGQLVPIPPASPLEKFYLMFVDAHIQSNGYHNGRDTTTDNINKVHSSTFIKELIADLIKACPGCNTRDAQKSRQATVEGARATRESKKRSAENGIFVENIPKRKKAAILEHRCQCVPACVDNNCQRRGDVRAQSERPRLPTPPDRIPFTADDYEDFMKEISNSPDAGGYQQQQAFGYPTPPMGLNDQDQLMGHQQYNLPADFMNFSQQPLPTNMAILPEQNLPVNNFPLIPMDAPLVDNSQPMSKEPMPLYIKRDAESLDSRLAEGSVSSPSDINTQVSQRTSLSEEDYEQLAQRLENAGLLEQYMAPQPNMQAANVDLNVANNFILQPQLDQQQLIQPRLAQPPFVQPQFIQQTGTPPQDNGLQGMQAQFVQPQMLAIDPQLISNNAPFNNNNNIIQENNAPIDNNIAINQVSDNIPSVEEIMAYANQHLSQMSSVNVEEQQQQEVDFDEWLAQL